MQGAVTMGAFIFVFLATLHLFPTALCLLLPPTYLTFVLVTVDVSMRTQPIHHSFSLKGTLTAVNGCNKTKQ